MKGYPACGSGHFLLAAAPRIAARIAGVRTGGVPSAGRLSACPAGCGTVLIHGVDRNPMAIELAK